MEKIIFLLLLLASPVFAESPQELFKLGNAAYAEGKFADAANKYLEARQAGARHWVLDYNLGNAFFRQGQTGKAILHYEKAFRLNSGHKDIVYNLNLATLRAGDPRLPASALVVLGWKAFFYISVNTLTVFTSLLFLALIAGIGLLLAGRKTVPGEALIGVLGIFFLSGAWLAARIYVLEQPRGVVVSPVAEVRSGPSTTYSANFTVPEGHYVLILEQQERVQGWHQIGVPKEGLRGWVPESSVEII